MRCLQCDLADLLEASRPPDPEMVDLIGQAFLERQNDRLKADLAYSWLLTRSMQRETENRAGD